MSTNLTARLARATLLAAGLGITAGAAQAAANLTLPIGTCAPANVSTLQIDLKLTSGAVRRAGRNPPGSRYFCGLPIDDLAASQGLNTFEFQFIDRNPTGNGNLSARLMRRNLTTGVTTTLARLDSVPSSTLKTLRVALPSPLDPAHNVYFAIIDMQPAGQRLEAHTVGLAKR